MDNFIDSSSYFSKSTEEIVSLYHAIKQPDNFKNVFESLGLAETQFKMAKNKSVQIIKAEKDSVNSKLLDLLVDLDKSPELPEIKPKTNLEALISPRENNRNGIGNITNFKNIYEDPRKDPRYKYQTSPFKEPMNDIERRFDEFLKSIREDNEERQTLRTIKVKPNASLPVFQSINKAFSPYFTRLPTQKKSSGLSNKVKFNFIGEQTEEVKEFNHDRALKNWAKVRNIMNLSVFNKAGLKGAMTKKLKNLAKAGQLKDVINVTSKKLTENEHKKAEKRQKTIHKLAKEKRKCCNLIFRVVQTTSI